MARPIWKGMISFGLVSVPVVLYPAEQSHALSFSMLDKRDFAPIGYKRYNKTTGKEVPWNDIVKGYEYEKDQFVVMSEEDFRRANVQQARSVDIVTFVDAGSIPPQYFATPYYLVPGERGQKVYALLRETMRATGKVGVGQVVIRTTHHLAAVVPIDDALMMITMRYANEIRARKEFDFPSTNMKSVGVTPKELELARKLIEDMAGDWKPEGETAEPRSAQVIDLMDLLKQSLSGEGRAKKTGARAPARREASVTEVSDAPKARARKSAKAAASKAAAEPKASARRKRA